MNIPGQAKEELKKLYGLNDPLDFIEEAEVTSSWDINIVHLKLRVPSSCLRYLSSVTFPPAVKAVENKILQDEVDAMLYGHRHYAVHALGEWGSARPGKLVPTPKQVIFSGPKTIVIWPDDTKTIVSVGEGDDYDEYDGFCAAIVKKMFGSTHRAKKFLESIAKRPKCKAKKKAEAEEKLDDC